MRLNRHGPSIATCKKIEHQKQTSPENPTFWHRPLMPSLNGFMWATRCQKPSPQPKIRRESNHPFGIPSHSRLSHIDPYFHQGSHHRSQFQSDGHGRVEIFHLALCDVALQLGGCRTPRLGSMGYSQNSLLHRTFPYQNCHVAISRYIIYMSSGRNYMLNVMPYTN